MRPSILVAIGLGIGALWVRSATAKPADVASPDATTTAGDLAGALLNIAAPVYEAANLMGLKTSPAGLDALKQREGFSAMPYPDATGYSVGYGHFIKPWEDFSGGVDESQAADLLASDVGTAEGAVNSHVAVPLTQNQFDALVSFTYNAGVGAFANSTLLQLLNAGDIEGAAAQFARWNKKHLPDGSLVVDASLTARRASESAQFVA